MVYRSPAFELPRPTPFTSRIWYGIGVGLSATFLPLLGMYLARRRDQPGPHAPPLPPDEPKTGIATTVDTVDTVDTSTTSKLGADVKTVAKALDIDARPNRAKVKKVPVASNIKSSATIVSPPPKQEAPSASGDVEMPSSPTVKTPLLEDDTGFTVVKRRNRRPPGPRPQEIPAKSQGRIAHRQSVGASAAVRPPCPGTQVQAPPFPRPTYTPLPTGPAARAGSDKVQTERPFRQVAGNVPPGIALRSVDGSPAQLHLDATVWPVMDRKTRPATCPVKVQKARKQQKSKVSQTLVGLEPFHLLIPFTFRSPWMSTRTLRLWWS